MSRAISGRVFADQYHNEATRAARVEDFDRAAKIIAEGLERFPENVDLLADYLFYDPGDIDGEYSRERKMAKFLELWHIGRERFTWRAFDFAIDYLIDDALVQKNDTDQRTTLLGYALALAKDYIKYQTTDERSYAAMAKVLRERNISVTDKNAHGISDSDRVEDLYRSVTLGLYGAEAEDGDLEDDRFKEDDLCKSWRSAADKYKDKPFPVFATCVRYSEMLQSRGEYERAIQVANIGLIGSAQEQPSSQVGYLLQTRALSRDAMIQRLLFKMGETPEEAEDYQALPGLMSDVMSDYHLAKKLLGTHNSFVDNIERRLSLLRSISKRLQLDVGEVNETQTEGEPPIVTIDGNMTLEEITGLLTVVLNKLQREHNMTQENLVRYLNFVVNKVLQENQGNKS